MVIAGNSPGRLSPNKVQADEREHDRQQAAPLNNLAILLPGARDVVATIAMGSDFGR
jgi:hypothetical protein